MEARSAVNDDFERVASVISMLLDSDPSWMSTTVEKSAEEKTPELQNPTI